MHMRAHFNHLIDCVLYHQVIGLLSLICVGFIKVVKMANSISFPYLDGNALYLYFLHTYR